MIRSAPETAILERLTLSENALTVELENGGSARMGFHAGMDLHALAQQLRVLTFQLERHSLSSAHSRAAMSRHMVSVTDAVK